MADTAAAVQEEEVLVAPEEVAVTLVEAEEVASEAAEVEAAVEAAAATKTQP